MLGLFFFSMVSSFNFAEDCFICGAPCNVTGDPKHPDRWKKNPGILCTTDDRGKSKQRVPRKSFKDVMLEVCSKRDGILGDTVTVCIQGAPSDLHATDAR